MITFYKNNTYYLETSIIDHDGNFVTSLPSGETISYALKRSSDGVTISSGDMALDGNIWKISYTFTQTGEYRIEYTTPEGYENGMDEILVLEESQHPTIIAEKLNRILGLCQENYRIFTPQYDKHMNLIAGTIKTYPTANDCENNTNELAEYEITATFDNKNRMTAYKMKKV